MDKNGRIAIMLVLAFGWLQSKKYLVETKIEQENKNGGYRGVDYVDTYGNNLPSKGYSASASKSKPSPVKKKPAKERCDKYSSYKCEGKCIGLAIPCQGKCKEGYFIFADQGKTSFCIDSSKYYLCESALLPTHQPCKGLCHEKQPYKCGNDCYTADWEKYYYGCNGECVEKHVPCNGTCQEENPLQCPDSCKREDEVLPYIDSIYAKYWICNGKCISVSVPCDGKCSPAKPKLCGNECMVEGETIDCNGQCQSSAIPCNSKCDKNKEKPVVCGRECIEEERVYENKDKPKANRSWFGGGPSSYLQDCNGTCINVDRPCNNKCIHKAFPHLCGESCVESSEFLWECDGKCQRKDEPCQGACPPELPHLCDKKFSISQDRMDKTCVDETEFKEKYQDCSGKCMLPNLACNGKCVQSDLPLLCIDHCLADLTTCRGGWEVMKPIIIID